MLVIYAPLLVLLLYYAIYSFFTRTFNYWKKKNVAFAQPTAFYGNLKESVLRKKNIGVVIQEIYNQFPNEKIVGVFRMTNPCLLIRDLDLIKHIMIKDFDFFVERGIEFSKDGLGQNMFHADGETWRALKSRFTPLFTAGKLKNMFPIIVDRANHFIDYIGQEFEISSEFEIHSLVQKYSVSSISACAFGINIDLTKDNLDELKRIDKLILEPNYGLELDMMFPGILKKINISLMPTPVHHFYKTLVENIKAQRGGKPSNRNDFMDLILEMRQKGEINSKNKSIEITDNVIAAQAFIFYLAGYETTATTMSYMLYHLALNSNIQNKLIKEIDEVASANDGQFTYDSVKELKYLRKVFEETLRMHSIVEPLQRKALADYKLPDTDIVIKKGQIVLVSPRGIHYDPKYYTKPDVFDPERFDLAVARERHPCAFLPFGVGQRNCIGLQFGRLQTLLGMAKFMSNFTVEPSQNTKYDLGINPNRTIVGPDCGIYLNIIPRNK